MSSAARGKALAYLARFSRTEQQVESYLRRKGFETGDIREALEYLRERRFLNDTSFAESFIRSKIQRCDGPLKIKQMLYGKGVASAIADELLRTFYPQELQVENAVKLMKKRRESTREKLMRFVASRGFPRYVIIQAFKLLQS